MFVADNGLDWTISVTPDSRIPLLHEEFSRIKGSAFEVVDAIRKMRFGSQSDEPLFCTNAAINLVISARAFLHSTFHGLAFLADRSGLPRLLDMLHRVGYLAGRIPHVDRNRADLGRRPQARSLSPRTYVPSAIKKLFIALRTAFGS